MDKSTTIGEIKNLIEKFVVQRDWAKFHSPKNLSMAISIEASELMDLFKWHNEPESIELMRRADTKSAASDELADIIIYCLAFANRNEIDIAKVIKRKIHKNRSKYPARSFKGRF